MNKICTSIEQSKKLLEIGIDINTADMYYEEVCNLPKAIVGNYILHNQCMEDKDYKKLSNPVLSPAWSLAALLDVLPYPSIHKHADETWWCDAWVDKVNPYSLRHFKTPIEASYEMIIKLHEQKLL